MAVKPRGFADALTATPAKEVEKWWQPLSLEDLRAHLTGSWPIPKDGFVDTDVSGLHSNPYRYRDRNFEHAVLHALTAAAATPAEHALALRIANCKRHQRCRRISCYVCNQRYWRKRRALLAQFANESGADAISWCTIIISSSQIGYPALRTSIANFKEAFTNTLKRFPHVKWSGRIEIDYIDQKICKVTPKKVKTLCTLGWDQASEMPTLVAHVHLVVTHAGVRRETLGFHLRRTFPGFARVQVRPLRTTCDHPVSLDRLARYPLKPPLEKPFWRRRGAKDAGPRHPNAVRYATKLREAFDNPGKGRTLEFDHY